MQVAGRRIRYSVTVLHGTWNHLECAIGARGMGKSTHMCEQTLYLQGISGAYVIGHSLGSRLPRALPDGTVLPIRYHETIAKLQRGLRYYPSDWHILSPSLGSAETADDLLRYAETLSHAVMKQAWQTANPWGWHHRNVSYEGLSIRPVIVMVDEGIAVEGAGVSRKDDNRWFLQYIYSLRHNHIALMYSIQDASARSWRIIEQATEIYVFAIKHRWARDCLRPAGASEEQLDMIARLPKHEYVTLYSLDSSAARAPDPSVVFVTPEDTEVEVTALPRPEEDV